jgi:hypothetical protein
MKTQERRLQSQIFSDFSGKEEFIGYRSQAEQSESLSHLYLIKKRANMNFKATLSFKLATTNFKF